MLDISYKEILWIVTILIVIPQVYLYIKSILIWETKPHIYTKIIWFILTGIGFIVSLQKWGGPWSWVLWVTCLVQLITLLLSFKYWSKDITRFDTILLILALLCIPLYLWVENKIYSLIFVLFIDFLWYIPTFRKTYNDPWSENLFVWNLSNSKYIISIFALIEYSFYTLAYPVFLIIANGILIWIMVMRRNNSV